jgi:hypothetical protein
VVDYSFHRPRPEGKSAEGTTVILLALKFKYFVAGLPVQLSHSLVFNAIRMVLFVFLIVLPHLRLAVLVFFGIG